MLPGAQVGETELEEIVKIGQMGEKSKALVAEGSEATSKLIGEYEGLEGARMARTPRTAPQRKSLLCIWINRVLTFDRMNRGQRFD